MPSSRAAQGNGGRPSTGVSGPRPAVTGRRWTDHDQPARPAHRRPLDVRPAPTAAAVAAAAQAAGASLVAVLAPVVLAWVVDSAGRGTWVQAVRLALALWLLAQHGGLDRRRRPRRPGALGLSLFPLAACWFGGRRLARALDPRAEAIAAGATRAVPAWPPAVALATFPTAYCTGVAIAALAADMPSMHPIGLQAVFGAAVVSSVGVTLGAAGYRHGVRWQGSCGWCRPARAPRALLRARGRRAGGAAAAPRLLVLAALLGAGHARVVELHQALQPGAAGGAVLTLGQALVMPNLVLWTSAALAGPGFGVGAAAGSRCRPRSWAPCRPCRCSARSRRPAGSPWPRSRCSACPSSPASSQARCYAVAGGSGTSSPAGSGTSPASRCSRGRGWRCSRGCRAARPAPDGSPRRALAVADRRRVRCRGRGRGQRSRSPPARPSSPFARAMRRAAR